MLGESNLMRSWKQSSTFDKNSINTIHSYHHLTQLVMRWDRMEWDWTSKYYVNYLSGISNDPVYRHRRYRHLHLWWRKPLLVPQKRNTETQSKNGHTATNFRRRSDEGNHVFLSPLTYETRIEERFHIHRAYCLRS